MRKNLILLAILLVALGVYFLFLHNRDSSSVAPDEISFAIEDTSAVYSILLTQYERGSVTQSLGLYRQGDGTWSLNNEFPAFQPRINQLLRVMHLIHVKELLAEKGQESARQIIEITHTKVEAYDRDGDLIKSYYMSVEGKGGLGTLMQLEDASMPVMVEMPGLQGFVNAYYSLDPLFWRENLLFNADLKLIRSIEIQYPQTPEQSLTLLSQVSGLAWEVAGLEVDSFRLAQYLEAYQGKIYAESFANQNYPDMYEELSEKSPDIRFVVNYRDDTQRSFVLFDRADNPNNYFGWVEGGNELLTIQNYVIDKFLLHAGEIL
jgi:hypothetical protein